MRFSIFMLLTLAALIIVYLTIMYIKMASLVDRRLAVGPFSRTADIFSAPQRINTGDTMTAEEFLARMQRSGYATAGSGARVEVKRVDGAGHNAAVEFEDGKILRISLLPGGYLLSTLDVKPALLTNLSGRRERRRLVKFTEIPRSLVWAVVSAEDKRFFHHAGFDPLRAIKAAYVDFRKGRKEQGASTLSMQLARTLWLDPDKRWKRKLQEVLMAMHIERRLSKQQIFEYYANQVYLGRRGTFSINGFAEGAHAFLGKDLRGVTQGEAALLAGLTRRPSYYNPFRYPERARIRRDVVLRQMRENGYLNNGEYANAVAAPLQLASEYAGVDQNQYFVDLVQDELRRRLGARAEKGRRIYTTLDPILQAAAEAAVQAGMVKVDWQLRGRKVPPGQPQVALIALDPRTGAVKALVGGRDYSASQFNHATASRQPGSVFKPFVYAAALNAALENKTTVFTPASVLNDGPVTFFSGGQLYKPGNYHHRYMGAVSMRTALMHSLNAATLNLGAMVGFDKVVKMARSAGLNDAIQSTPAVALGAYECTPIEIAGAYTAFATGGTRVVPWMLSEVRDVNDRVLYRHSIERHAAIDPRVAYLMVSMLEDVLNGGTGAGVRATGFRLPAAGKTGTSRDGWFAGFTSELLCVVWVGFDDNRDLKLEGARSALPVWAEFMNRAARYRPYRDAAPFEAPAGIQSVSICADSGQLAGPFCPRRRTEVFLKGTAPPQKCTLHGPARIRTISVPDDEDVPQ